MTPEERAELQQAVAEIVQGFDLLRSALMDFSVRLREIGAPPTARVEGGTYPVRSCDGCGELMRDDGYDYCSASCYAEQERRERARYQGGRELQRPDDAPDECLPFCEEHETCREQARLYTAQRLGFAWTREQQRLREEHLAQHWPEYTVIVERAVTPEGSGLRARIPALGLSTWVERDDDPDWYTGPYGWAMEAIAVHLQVPMDSFGVLEMYPADAPEEQVPDPRPVYDDPHANPEEDVLQKITRLEDEDRPRRERPQRRSKFRRSQVF